MCFINEQRCFVVFRLKIHFFSGRFIKKEAKPIDCKTVRIFAYSSTREQSKAENRERDWGETPHTPVGRVRLARFARIRLLRHALPISLLFLRKKPTVLQSTKPSAGINK